MLCILRVMWDLSNGRKNIQFKFIFSRMSIEAVQKKKYSEKVFLSFSELILQSDVWSFGVCASEILNREEVVHLFILFLLCSLILDMMLCKLLLLSSQKDFDLLFLTGFLLNFELYFNLVGRKRKEVLILIFSEWILITDLHLL
jgi:hypothetical protein